MSQSSPFAPENAGGPVTLPSVGVALDEQVRELLATDTDPTVGLLAGLGYGADSIYPNPGGSPSTNRDECAVPFLIVLPGGRRAKDRLVREHRVIVEIHDTATENLTRIVGVLQRLEDVLLRGEWRPTNDAYTRYTSGLSFEESSPPLPSETYGTQLVQVVFLCLGADRTSGRGYQG